MQRSWRVEVDGNETKEGQSASPSGIVDKKQMEKNKKENKKNKKKTTTNKRSEARRVRGAGVAG